MQPPVYSKVTQCGNFLRHQLEVYIRKPPHRISQKKEEEQAKKTSKITSTSRQERKRDIEKTPTPEERRTSEEDVQDNKHISTESKKRYREDADVPC